MAMFIGMRLYLQRQNKELERQEAEDVQLQEEDIRKLQQTAEIKGVDVDTARAMQKGYRYMI